MLRRDLEYNSIGGTVPTLLFASTVLVDIELRSNFLSCEISVGSRPMGNRSNKPLVLLGAPGNRFAALPASRPLDPIVGPSFDAASSVAYLWVGTVWQTWRWPLLSCALGFVALFATVATTGVIFLPEPPSLCVNLLPTAPHTAVQCGVPAMLTRLRRFVRFKPDHAVGAAQLWCARLCAWSAVPCVAVVTILNCFVSTCQNMFKHSLKGRVHAKRDENRMRSDPA